MYKIAFNTFFLIRVVCKGGEKHRILDVVSLACLGGSNSFYVICNDAAYEYQNCCYQKITIWKMSTFKQMLHFFNLNPETKCHYTE